MTQYIFHEPAAYEFKDRDGTTASLVSTPRWSAEQQLVEKLEDARQ